MFSLIVTGFQGIVVNEMMTGIVLFAGIMSVPTVSQMNQQTTLIRIPFLAYVALNIIRHDSYSGAFGEANRLKLNGSIVGPHCENHESSCSRHVISSTLISKIAKCGEVDCQSKGSCC